MNCHQCGRELKEDSRFCDNCGNRIFTDEISIETSFDKQKLLSGIFFSIIISVLITGAALLFKLPLLFGGLFLPFFWIRKKSKDRG